MSPPFTYTVSTHSTQKETMLCNIHSWMTVINNFAQVSIIVIMIHLTIKLIHIREYEQLQCILHPHFIYDQHTAVVSVSLCLIFPLWWKKGSVQYILDRVCLSNFVLAYFVIWVFYFRHIWSVWSYPSTCININT